MTKRPLDINEMLAAIREAVKPFRPAALFELAAEGYRSLFEQLIACIISIRTYDEQTVPLARQLFSHGRTPEAIAQLSAEEIAHLIKPATFYERKGVQIRAIAVAAVAQYGGALPCDAEVLTGFEGVGPKCAHLALGVACGLPTISVDVHVHRVTNRWGYVASRRPEETMAQLERVLPKAYWVEINRLLVPFGKHICTGAAPRCSTCPVLAMCRQVGVTQHR